MRIAILEEARDDLIQGSRDSLLVYAGIHHVTYTYHRCLAKRFPFAIYYSLEGELVRVHAVLDCRRNPSWIRKRLTDDA